MAKLKEGVEVAPFGYNGKIYSDKIDDVTARFFLESGRCTEEEFEELPKGITAKAGAKDSAENKYDTIAKIRERLDELQYPYQPKGLTKADFEALLLEAEAAAKAGAKDEGEGAE